MEAPNTAKVELTGQPLFNKAHNCNNNPSKDSAAHVLYSCRAAALWRGASPEGPSGSHAKGSAMAKHFGENEEKETLKGYTVRICAACKVWDCSIFHVQSNKSTLLSAPSSCGRRVLSRVFSSFCNVATAAALSVGLAHVTVLQQTALFISKCCPRPRLSLCV
jgi:hypothetical protein